MELATKLSLQTRRTAQVQRNAPIEEDVGCQEEYGLARAPALIRLASFPGYSVHPQEFAVTGGTVRASVEGEEDGDCEMAKRGRSGPVRRLPWGDDAWPDDWSRTRLAKRGRRRSPRPGGRTGPVRSNKRR